MDALKDIDIQEALLLDTNSTTKELIPEIGLFFIGVIIDLINNNNSMI